MGEVDLVAEVRENHREIESDLGNQCGTCHDLWPCAEIRLADAYDRLREALDARHNEIARSSKTVIDLREALETIKHARGICSVIVGPRDVTAYTIARAALHTNDGSGTEGGGDG